MNDRQEKVSDTEKILICSTCGLHNLNPKTTFCSDCGSKLSISNSESPDFLKGVFFVLGGLIGLMLFGGLAVSIIPDGINGLLGFLLIFFSLIIGFLAGGLFANKLLKMAWKRN